MCKQKYRDTETAEHIYLSGCTKIKKVKIAFWKQTKPLSLTSLPSPWQDHVSAFLHSVSFFIPHTFPFPSSHSPSLAHAQADRKCQGRPGYFRPNWEIDVHSETWHLDMPFILSHALPPKLQKPDMLTAYWKTYNCPFEDFSLQANIWDGIKAISCISPQVDKTLEIFSQSVIVMNEP